MKYIVILIIATFALADVSAQYISSLVFSSGGVSAAGSGIYMTSTIGQVFTNFTIRNAPFSLSSGVQQPELKVNPVNPNYFSQQFEASCYPNPFRDEINIRIKNPDKHTFNIQLYDITGRKFEISTNRFSDEMQENYSVNLSKLAEGQYIIKLIDTEKTRAIMQFKILKIK